MSYYPYGIWCKRFGCWSSLVNIANKNDCDGDCEKCEDSQEIKK